MPKQPIPLSFERVGVRRGPLLAVGNVTLRVTMPGVLFIIGAGGAGKSSLLAALAGSDEVELEGTATFGEHPVAREADAAWLRQREALEGAGSVAEALAARGIDTVIAQAWLVEVGVVEGTAVLDASVASLPLALRRYLAVRAALERDAVLYLLDEPTVDLDHAAALAVLARIANIAARAAVLMITHNRRDCLALGGHVALIAGGTLQEQASVAHFFNNPATPAGRLYVETGNCGLPVDPIRRAAPSEAGIWWLVPGLLCGMSRPGLSADIGDKLRTLVESGVEMLVGAEQSTTLGREVAAAGLRFRHVPIPDMGAPSFAQAVDLCRDVEPIICANRGVAVHCRGGLGRTGTLLAVILIWVGDCADEAIAKVRAARPLAIQSKAQWLFLSEFAERIGGWR